VRSSGAPADSNSPASRALAEGARMYDKAATTLAVMSPGACGQVGGSQPHTNLQPYLPLKWIIAYEGLYPTEA
jgi:microcystin-dependent protein